MHDGHIALQGLQVDVLILHRMAFHLPSKLVALHLDNSTANSYIHNQGDTESISFQTRLQHIESGQQAQHYSSSNIYVYPSHCGSLLSVAGKVGFMMSDSFFRA